MKKIEIPIFESDKSIGLTESQVMERKTANLYNKTKSGSSRSVAGIIFKEIFTYFNMIYMIITAILLYVGAYTQLTFLVIIIPNTLIAIIQQIKSKHTIDKLSLLVKTKATVIRDGKETQIETEDVVRDDVILFSHGGQICVDCIVLDGECRVNESLLTGESLSIKKQVGDKLFAGSFITSGSVVARTTEVGEDSFVQKLTSQAKKYRKPKSEILNALNSIIQIIGIAIIPISIFLFIRTGEIIKTAGAVIGMIPSGMFLLTTIALAVSVMRLSKHKTLVQELYCIEMLARVDTLCMDKTGTITDGTMKVDEVITLNEQQNTRPVDEIIGNMLASVTTDNATSTALKNHFKTNKSLSCEKYYAFSSETKFFACDYGDSGVYFLGAPEYVANLEKYPNIVEKCNNFSHKGERVLLLCHAKSYDESNFDKNTNIPVGLISLIDNVRQDAIDTIKFFKENNVNLKVISGDNEVTVSEIAKRAGLLNAEKCISLQDKTDEEVISLANDYNVFGRVSPKQKELLVKSMKAQNHTVAMVGDGVNDILALREADCSIAVGAGSESAKNVSHLILIDSNFSHMQNVVAEGRRCINNLQMSSTLFLTKTAIAIILSIFCILTANHYPFSPNQLMILELFAIGVPGFFFALQPNKNIVKGRFLDSILVKSISQAVSALLFVLPLYILLKIHPEAFDIEQIETLIVLIVTMNSLIVLARTAHPYNKFRLAITISMFVLSFIAFILFSNVAGLNLFSGTILNNYLGLEQISIVAVCLFLGISLLLFPTQHYLQKLIYFIGNSKKIITKNKN